MVKTVVFDIDNTLYSYTKANEAAIQALAAYTEEQLGWTCEEFKALHRRTMDELTCYMGDVAAIHNRTIRYQNMLESMGCALYPHALKMDEIYWDTLIEAATPSDGAVELLHQLKQQGLRIGIGTDMTARIQLRKLTELGMLPYVDFLVSSEEAGVEKPAPEFFARCVAKAGCESRECLFIGDNLKKDVFGALNAGWKAVWYCPEGAQMGDDILQIANFAQLPELLGKL